MKVIFDKQLYTEEAIKKAYSELTGSELKKVKKSGKNYVLELPEDTEKDEIHYFENMVLLYTIEDKRK